MRHYFNCNQITICFISEKKKKIQFAELVGCYFTTYYGISACIFVAAASFIPLISSREWKTVDLRVELHSTVSVVSLWLLTQISVILTQSLLV